MTERSMSTKCCISGGGPAGIMLGFLLARSGVDVIVLEKWPDFFRDFRGDTIHPSTMEILSELGLLEAFRSLPHNETKQIAAHIGDQEVIIADFTKLKTVCPFLAFIPQWDFLNFITSEAKKYPNFHLLMETEAVDVLWDDSVNSEKKIIGVRAKDKQGEFDIHSKLVVAADGRHSTVREKSGLALTDSGAPIDVLWFRIARTDDGTDQSLGYINRGKMLVLIDRDEYWQCGYIIKKGDFDKAETGIKARGLESFQNDIASLVPTLKESAKALASWDQIKLLAVTVDHLEKWHLPGLICIGDSAHAMSPVGGVGINLAIQDAVAAANILVPAFYRLSSDGKLSGVRSGDLQAIQDRRMRAARLIQRLQVFVHTHVLAHVLGNTEEAKVPWQLRLFRQFLSLRKIPAYVIGIGFKPEHIKTEAK